MNALRGVTDEVPFGAVALGGTVASLCTCYLIVLFLVLVVAVFLNQNVQLKNLNRTVAAMNAALEERARGFVADIRGVLPGEHKGREDRRDGAGLTISPQLCHLMGGDISAESSVGVGSTFTARFPG